MLDKLLTQTPDDVAFLTPNARLTTHFQSLIDAARFTKETLISNDNAIVAESTLVLPYDSWVGQKRQSALLKGQVKPLCVMTKAEESALWSALVDQLTAESSFSALAQPLQEVQKAYRLCREWFIDLQDNRFSFQTNPDCALFYEWASRFKQNAEDKGLIARVDSDIELLSSPLSTEREKVVLIGFEKLAPLQQALLSHYCCPKWLAHNGSISNPCQSASIIKSPDFETEVHSAAQWAKKIHKDSPDARIGIVVKDLLQQKLLVERIMLKAFEPEALVTGTAYSGSSMNISAGLPLDKTPVGASLLTVMSAFLTTLSIEQWQQLLVSPYLFSTNDRTDFTTQLLAALDKSGITTCAIHELPRLLEWRLKRYKKSTLDASIENNTAIGKEESNKKGSAYLLNQVINDIRDFKRSLKNKPVDLPSVWIIKLVQLAEKLGWPGSERTLNSDEYQQWKRLQQAVEEFYRYDKVLAKVTPQKALSVFKQYCHQLTFHRETLKQKATVLPQILGTLEASGQIFDHLWLLGMSDKQWPLPAQPSPMIPIGLQVDHQLPSSSAKIELDYAKALTRGFLNSASRIVFSFPVETDEVENSFSVLVETLLEKSTVEVEYSNNSNTALEATSPALLNVKEPYEYIADHFGCTWPIPIQDDGQKRLPGGAGAIKDFARNPLVSYLKRRMDIEPLTKKIIGITAMERGILLHAALESVWRELKTSTSLLAMNDEELAERIKKYLDIHSDQVFNFRFSAPGHRLVSLEKTALLRVLENWFRLEKERPNFEVNSVEEKISIEIAAVTIDGRIDRVDRLADNSYLLIDYKSGAIATKAWLDFPMTEPQLPLYVLALNEKLSRVEDEENNSVSSVSALTYASLKPGYLMFKGYSAEDIAANSIAGIQPIDTVSNIQGWEGLLFEWQNEIEYSVSSLLDGYAAMNTIMHDSDSSFESFVRSAFSLTTPEMAQRL